MENFFLESAKKYFLQIVLFAVVVIFFAKSPKKEKTVESALLNPKYHADKISLSYKKEGSAVLKKCGGFWTCECALPDGKLAAFPCDPKVVEGILESAKKIVFLNEVSDDLKFLQRFGLSNDDAFFLEFFEGEKTLSKLRFGNADFRGRISLFCESARNKKIYSTDSEILSYLNCSADFWCDPHIFPKSVCGAFGEAAEAKLVFGAEDFRDEKIGRSHFRPLDVSQIEKLLHGKLIFEERSEKAFFANFGENEESDFFLGADSELPKNFSVRIDDGKSNLYFAAFSRVGGEEYLCRFFAEPSGARESCERLAIEGFRYASKVSAWTVKKMLEM